MTIDENEDIPTAIQRTDFKRNNLFLGVFLSYFTDCSCSTGYENSEIDRKMSERKNYGVATKHIKIQEENY